MVSSYWIAQFNGRSTLTTLQIVNKDSAVLQLPNETAVGVAESNHRTMCRFDDRDCQKYKPVWLAIKSLA